WTHRNYWRPPAGTEAAEARPKAEPRVQVFGISPSLDGGFFAAVYNRGIWRWDGREMRQLGRAQGLFEDVRFALEPEPGVVWVAARFGIFESRGGAPFRKTLNLPTGFVYAFLRGADGRFYAPTSSFGVFVHQDGEWRPAESWNSRLPSANVR